MINEKVIKIVEMDDRGGFIILKVLYFQEEMLMEKKINIQRKFYNG
jgi:hypothetical protein